MELLDELFTYHPPGDGDAERYQAIREAAKALAHVIVENAPPCQDRHEAIRKVREAVMTANAAIATQGAC